MRASRTRVRGLAADCQHFSLRAQARTDHDDACGSDVPRGVHGSIQLHVDIVDLGWAVAASHRAGADTELREALNYAVRNVQRIARLPVNSISHALGADLHVLQ